MRGWRKNVILARVYALWYFSVYINTYTRPMSEVCSFVRSVGRSVDGRSAVCWCGNSGSSSNSTSPVDASPWKIKMIFSSLFHDFLFFECKWMQTSVGCSNDQRQSNGWDFEAIICGVGKWSSSNLKFLLKYFAFPDFSRIHLNRNQNVGLLENRQTADFLLSASLW